MPGRPRFHYRLTREIRIVETEQRSSKSIQLDGHKFYICYAIIGTEQYLLPHELEDAGILLQAMKTGNFFVDESLPLHSPFPCDTNKAFKFAPL
jgi:hypothetical protein